MHDQDPLDSQALFRLFDRPIAYHKCFADISGSVAAAVMLSQSVYWTKTLPPEKDGWFYKTAAEWQEETGMTRSEQENARRKLKTIGVLQEKKEGVPCKLYYRINVLAIRELILGTKKIVDLDTFLEINEQSLLSLSRTGLMRATKLQAERQYVDYRDVVKTHGLHCHVCNQAIDFGMNMSKIAFDHVVPLSKGGSHTFDNIRPAHQKCNQQKGSKALEESCLSEQSIPVCQNKANKDVLTNQSRASEQNSQDGFDKTNNLYTEITTEIRADEFFAIAPSSQIQENSFRAQTENPRIQETPNPQSPLSPCFVINSVERDSPESLFFEVLVCSENVKFMGFMTIGGGEKQGGCAVHATKQTEELKELRQMPPELRLNMAKNLLSSILRIPKQELPIATNTPVYPQKQVAELGGAWTKKLSASLHSTSPQESPRKIWDGIATVAEYSIKTLPSLTWIELWKDETEVDMLRATCKSFAQIATDVKPKISHGGSPINYPDPMGDRFKQGKPKHRYSALVSTNPEWSVLDDWCTGKQLGDFKPSLIKATIAHLKKWEHPFETGDAINCLAGYIKRRDLDGFEGRIQEALKLETAQAIATQVPPPPVETPQQSAPQIDPIARQRMIEEARRRVAQQAA